MRVIADLHIHSKYSRATSPDMHPAEIARWADKKGIAVIGSGDFQHPAYFGELKNKLEPAEPGLFRVRRKKSGARLMLTTEISSIYKQAGRVRKIHTLVLMPSIDTAEKFSKKLASMGNTASDGRPILGISAKELAKITLDIDADAMVVPAHVWTPWFSVFGSKSGFDSLEECFEEMTPHITAVETGLSADADANHRISFLDKIPLISNSDAHSPSKIGREANVLECELSYLGIKKAIESRSPKKFLHTVEFFPEEGKYHYDGHRLCGINYHPRESLAAKNRCPVCFKPLTLGVLHRIEALSDRPWDFKLKGSVPQKRMIPLEEIIADVKGLGVQSKKVRADYELMIAKGGTEFEILLDRGAEELREIAGEEMAEAILRVRAGKVNIIPGFDGEFGKISIFRDMEKIKSKEAVIQMRMFGQDE